MRPHRLFDCQPQRCASPALASQQVICLGESDEPRAVEGLPGTWFGIEYDFVSGEAGDTPGLPDEVVRCLDGT